MTRRRHLKLLPPDHPPVKVGDYTPDAMAEVLATVGVKVSADYWIKLGPREKWQPLDDRTLAAAMDRAWQHCYRIDSAGHRRPWRPGRSTALRLIRAVSAGPLNGRCPTEAGHRPDHHNPTSEGVFNEHITTR